MGSESIRVTDVFAVSPERIYAAWLDSIEHSAFTGGKATASPAVEGRFTAWDGYIEGANLELEPGRRIVQSWRSTDFPAEEPDSKLEVLLEPEGDGTRVTLIHTEIPAGQGAEYETGWRDYYFRPMQAYFSRAGLLEKQEGKEPRRVRPKGKALKAARKTKAAKKSAPAAKKKTPAKKKAAPAKKKTAAKKKAAPAKKKTAARSKA